MGRVHTKYQVNGFEINVEETFKLKNFTDQSKVKNAEGP
jgi:hypothetical protein